MCFQTSAFVLPIAPTVETRATQLRFLSRCPRWHLVRTGLAIAAATVRSWIEQRKSNGAQSTLLLQSYVWSTTLKKNGTTSTYERAPGPTAVKTYLTTVQEKANSSAWNHIFKFRRRGRDGRRSRKLLSLCHTHGSAPRSPHLPYQIMDSWKSSELEQNDGISYRKIQR